MRLNRTSSSWTEVERNKMNENWRIIEGLGGKVDNIVDEISDEAFDKIVDSAKLDWKDPVDSFDDLPSSASEGETRMVRDTGKVYRFNGMVWQEIQQIDVSPVNEVDSRLTAQLADTDNHFKNVKFATNRMKEAMVLWIDDDGDVLFKDVLVPLGKEYGISITSALCTGWMGEQPRSVKFMSEEEAKEVIEEGFEIISHSHLAHDPNNRPSNWSYEDLLNDLITSREIIRELGGNPYGYVHPFGDYTDREKEIASKVFEYAGANNRFNNTRTIEPPFDMFDMQRANLQGTPLQTLKNLVNEAIERKSLLIVKSHVGQAEPQAFDESLVREFIEYTLGKDIKWVNFAEAMETHGNLLQFGKTREGLGTNSISADGEIFGDDWGKVKFDHSTDIGNDTPISYFEENKITYSLIRSNQNEGFPFQSPQRSGYLITYRMSDTGDNFYSYQELIDARENASFFRKWSDSQSRWLEWTDDTPTQYLGADGIGINDDPTNQKYLRKNSYTVITNETKDDFPEKESGHLYMMAKTNDSLISQIYITRLGKSMYFRNWNFAEGKWSAWRDMLNSRVEAIDTLTSDKKPKDYQLGISYEPVRVNYSEIFPGIGGMVITIKAADDRLGDYTRQWFFRNRDRETHMRWSEASGESWSDWHELSVDVEGVI